MRSTVRVLVVDDSAVMRKVLSDGLGKVPDIEVVATAPNARVARDKILALNPDVITLDVEMPDLDGLTFLKIMMRDRPMPVVVVSSRSPSGPDMSQVATDLGARHFVAKPSCANGETRDQWIAEVAMKVRAAVHGWQGPQRSPKVPSSARPLPMAGTASQTILAMGASTGGTEALRAVLATMPADSLGCVIVQHMPEKFTTAFARRLDAAGAVRVHEAANGDRVLQGHALLAPGGYHMTVERDVQGYMVRLTDGPPVNRHRPSVDVLFESVAGVAGRRSVGVILTGMGDDGARGLLAMREAGARTIAQDEATCVVFGMPREAIARGAAERVVPLNEVAALAVNLGARPAAMLSQVMNVARR